VSAYTLQGKDGFDIEAEHYDLPGEFATFGQALIAARERLAELAVSQPGASQGDIQDRVYIVHPGGHRERVWS
jgi:hypothetical protein